MPAINNRLIWALAEPLSGVECLLRFRHHIKCWRCQQNRHGQWLNTIIFPEKCSGELVKNGASFISAISHRSCRREGCGTILSGVREKIKRSKSQPGSWVVNHLEEKKKCCKLSWRSCLDTCRQLVLCAVLTRIMHMPLVGLNSLGFYFLFHSEDEDNWCFSCGRVGNLTSLITVHQVEGMEIGSLSDMGAFGLPWKKRHVIKATWASLVSLLHLWASLLSLLHPGSSFKTHTGLKWATLLCLP